MTNHMQLDFDGRETPMASLNRFDHPTAEPPPLPDTVPLFTEPDEPPPSSIEEAFLQFHAANGWVYEALVKMARDLIAQGRTRIGIKMLFEVLRWHYYRSTTDASSDFKINNNYAPHYARLIMSNEPALDGIFGTRKLQTP